MNPYESSKMLHEYLLFHYGAGAEVMPYDFGPTNAVDFPLRCVTENVNTALLSEQSTALDVGCSVGRTTFELARHCGRVIGIDYSDSFAQAGQRLVENGVHPYQRLEEGSLYTECEATIDSAIDRSRVSFEQGDAQALRADLGSFDVVLACNLICRLQEPMRFLERLPALVNPGGQLIITTPFTWLEEYTPPENWLGKAGGSEDSFAGLKSALQGSFELVQKKDMPFLIREHARKFQWSVAQATTWKRI